MKSLQRVVRGLLLATLGTGLAAVAWGEGYPERPVRVILPFSPGGAVDVPGRMLLSKLPEELGQQVVVDNRPGAGSTIGAEIVARAPADGYTLLAISTTHVISAALYKKLNYDAINDFTPIMQIGSQPYVLVVHPSLPVKSVKDLIALAKAKPGQIDYASSGNGSSQHLFAALFCSMAGIDMNHIPYKGSGQVRTDLLSGRVSVNFTGVSSVIQYIQNGRLRALGVTTAKRSPELPNVPTIAEAGVKGYQANLWWGLVGPKGLPENVVARLNTAVEKVLKTSALQSQYQKIGTEIVYRGPEQWDAYLKSERQKWAKVVKETGAQVN